MVTKKVSVTLCDKCKKDKPTSRYFITGPAGRTKLDLDDDCAAPLQRLLDLVEAKPARGRSRIASQEPVTMDQVRRARGRARGAGNGKGGR